MLCEDKKKYSKHRAEVEAKLHQFKQRRRAYECPHCFYWHITTQHKRLRDGTTVTKREEETEY